MEISLIYTSPGSLARYTPLEMGRVARSQSSGDSVPSWCEEGLTCTTLLHLNMR